MSEAKYVNLNAENFMDAVGKPLVLVDFWAPWCGPCRMLGPVIEELAADYENKASVCKLNVDDNQAIAARYGVMSIPTVLLFRNGQEVERMVGAQPKTAFAAALDKYL